MSSAAPPSGIYGQRLATSGKTVLNVLWLVLAGFWLAIAYVIAGIINCLFIITIPFGIQAFKLASYSLWPFNRMVVHRPGRDVALGCLGNALWFVFGGLWLALLHLATGLLLCVTVIGIPFGIANFKLAGLALAPFGTMIVPVSARPAPVVSLPPAIPPPPPRPPGLPLVPPPPPPPPASGI